MTIPISLIYLYFAAGFVFAFFYLLAVFRRNAQLTLHDMFFAILITQVWPHAMVISLFINKLAKKDFVMMKKKRKL